METFGPGPSVATGRVPRRAIPRDGRRYLPIFVTLRPAKIPFATTRVQRRDSVCWPHVLRVGTITAAETSGSHELSSGGHLASVVLMTGLAK